MSFSKILAAALLAGWLGAGSTAAWSQPPKSPLPLLKEAVTDEMRRQVEDFEDEHQELYLRLARNEEEKIRRKAVESLAACLPSERVVAALIDRSYDPEGRVRESALDALQSLQVKTPAVAAAVKRGLSDSHRGTRKSAVYSAAAFKEQGRAFLPELLKILADVDSHLTAETFDAIKDIGATPEIAPAVQATYPSQGSEAVYLLAGLKPPPKELIPWFRNIMHGKEDLRRRASAAWALGRCEDLSVLLAAARGKDEETRITGLEGLSGLRSPPPEAYALIAAGLADPSPRIREYSVQAASFIAAAPDELRAQMLAAMGDPDPKVRESAQGAFDRLIEKKEFTRNQAWKILDRALVAKPQDVGLNFAKAWVVLYLANDLAFHDDAKSAAMFNLGSKGLIQVVFKSDLKLTASEKRELGTYLYDAACITCRCERHELALRYLQLALETGWTDLKHARRDHDFDAVKDTAAFQQLLKKFEKSGN